MEKIIYEVLDLIEKNGFKAYIVGGYPRDCYLNIVSEDYDICTDATPEQLKKIFLEILSENYGSLKIRYQQKVIEITTFRIENSYVSTRTPIISYTSSLKEDLNRRDFIMNTLCMDKYGNYIDYMGAIHDIENCVIRSVGDPNQKMKEDPLRILRAIRFSSILKFKIDEELENAIRENSVLVANLSYYRKREELDKIILFNEGIELLKKYDLDKILECSFQEIIVTDCIEAMWAQINCSSNYPFSKSERKKIETIRILLNKKKMEDIDLYYYGLDICKCVSKILKINFEILKRRYQLLPIHSKKDILISAHTIKEITNIHPSICYPILEKEILSGRLMNKEDDIEKFLYSYFVEK